MNESFSKMLERFFTLYIPLRRGLSKHTASSYSDSFLMLIRFMGSEKNLRPDQVTFDHINREAVLEFCDWLENVNGNTASTRNQRLTAIHAFFRYVQAEDPSKIEMCREILSVQLKKTGQTPPKSISMDAVEHVLAVVETRTQMGIRDLAILSLLYDSAARVQELIDLSVGDVMAGKPASVRLTGKGGKIRIVPIMRPTAKILENYIERHNLYVIGQPLFTNIRGRRLTRVGVNYILNKYVDRVKAIHPGMISIAVTPHVLRHAKATHMLSAGINLFYIRDMLGHSSVITTEIYARSNPEFLEKAVSQAALATTPTVPEVTGKDALTELLKKFRC